MHQQNIPFASPFLQKALNASNSSLLPGLFIVSAKRTAFGTFGGKLKDRSATDLAEVASRAAIKAASISPDKIDHVVFGTFMQYMLEYDEFFLGNVIQTAKDAAYIARHVGLRVGIPESVPAVTINRLCGSGFQAIVDAALVRILQSSQAVLDSRC